MTEISSLLDSAHDALLHALAQLDSAGERAAAAHITAAMDLIEDRLDRQPETRRGHDDRHSPAILAQSLRDTFGDRADEIARAQLAEARGPAFLAWAAIVNRLDA